MTGETTYEYELIDISFDQPYELPEEESQMVHEDEPFEEQPQESDIEYDAEGIPMGCSKIEIKMRQRMIFQFYEDWKNSHPGKAVYNMSLNADILIRKESVVEAAVHASKRYKSTLAVFKLEEVLSQAVKVAIDAPKVGNKNQGKLIRMVLMSYSSPDLGLVKLTVGVRHRSLDKIQYGITALDEGEEIVPLVGNKKKKAPHKK